MSLCETIRRSRVCWQANPRGQAPIEASGECFNDPHALLHPARAPGVELKTHAPVERIVFEGNRAVGVEYLYGSAQVRQAVANGAVIVAAGYPSASQNP
jgi:choline dehydrogenase-like flavoprotein